MPFYITAFIQPEESSLNVYKNIGTDEISRGVATMHFDADHPFVGPPWSYNNLGEHSNLKKRARNSFPLSFSTETCICTRPLRWSRVLPPSVGAQQTIRPFESSKLCNVIVASDAVRGGD